MKRIIKPKIDAELLKAVKNTDVSDIDELFERAIEAGVRIYQMPRDCEPSNDDMVYLALAWSLDLEHFRDVLGMADVDVCTISEFEFFSCCIMEAAAASEMMG